MVESDNQQVKPLLVIEDNQGKRTISLEAERYSIGRNATNSIVLYSHLVSRQHATLVRVAEDPLLFRLVDGNLQGIRSTNGLKVNGKHCFERELNHQDEIVFAEDVKACYYSQVDSFAMVSENTAIENTKGSTTNTLIGVEREIANYSDAALLKLASFPEPIANPIIEIDLAGNITYINPSALGHFPEINDTKLQHPLLADIVPMVENGQETFFVREVEIGSKIFSQSVHYVAVSGLIRNYIVDITESKQIELALRESEAKNRALLNAIPDLMLRLDRHGNCLDYLPAKSSKDSLALRRDECLILPPEAIIQRTYYVNQALETGETQVFEYQLLVGGLVRHYETRIVVNGENEVLAIVRDISDRAIAEIELKNARNQLELRVEKRTKELRNANNLLLKEINIRHRAEEEVRFLQTMTQAIGESANFHSALGVALRLVCDFTGWAFGEAWIPKGGDRALECSPAWYRNTQNVDKFRQESENLTFLPGNGLPGRVWSSKQPEWMQNVSTAADTAFVRKTSALEVGFKSGLGIPIVEGDRVVAVLVFFMFTAGDEDQHLVKLVSTVATQLGSLIQRKQVEAALSDSEERFRLLVEGGKDYAIFMLDPEGNIISWNTGAERIKGYTSAEILGMPFSCFYTDEDCSMGKPEQLLHLAQVNGQTEDEGWRVCKGGVLIWVDAIITSLKDQNGQLRGFSHVVRNTTENRRSQQALQESEQRLQAILDNSTALIYVKDLQGRYITINAWFGIVFNIDREAIEGKTDYDFFPQEMADTYRANDLKVIETKSPLDWEEIALHDNGLLYTYLSVKFPLFDAAGEVYAVCGISTDISERKRAENALNSSLATNRALLDAIPDSMFRISMEGIFVNFKAAKNTHLPLQTQDFMGKSLYEVFPEQVATPMMDCVQLALTTKNVQIFEYKLLLDDRLLDYEARIAVSAENEVMAIIRDITERKRVETDIRNALEKEKELGELKSRFVTIASHEFRTPLATILSSSELLEYYSHKWSEDKKLKHQQRIQSSVKHMTNLLDDVLLIGKAEAGKLEFQPKLIDLGQLCRDLVEEVQVTTQTHTINFCLQELSSTHGLIDEKLLRHIIINLLTNAVKYSPQGRQVDFSLSSDRQNAIFSIQDRGIGISEEDRQQLFESFHRGKNVSNIPGTGLGLAIVKKSVDLHGGTIAIDSQLEVGTKFTVTLPLNQKV